MRWRALIRERENRQGNVIPPVALVIADTEDGAFDAVEALHCCKSDTAAAISLSEAEEHLERQSALRLVLLELRHDHGAVLDRLLSRLNQMAENDDLQAIVSAPIELVDCVSARCDSAQVTLLCQPRPLERIAAVSVALAELDSVLCEVRELDSLRLRRIAEEVNRIARTLSSLSSSGSVSGTPIAAPGDPRWAPHGDTGVGQAIPPMADDVRKLIRMRRLRESFFQPDLFADPAWDMLLDLFAAYLDGDRVAVSSLCIAAAVPPTTALRWIKSMTEAGLFEREADPLDGRRIFIRLSDAAAQAMSSYFAAVRRFEGTVI